MLPLLLIGNPEHLRVTSFQEALARRGHPPARVVRWLDFLRDPRTLSEIPDEPTLVRMDSFGQDFEVERAMLRRGYEAARALGVTALTPPEIDALEEDRGRILAPRQGHLGFESALDEAQSIFDQKKSWRILQPTPAIRALFDKRASWEIHERAGVPVPRAFRPEELPPASVVYVKLTSGSSASCLGIWDGRTLFTTMEIDGERLYNSRRVRRYDARASRRLLDYLLREGSHIEARVPKATIDRMYFDCRVIVLRDDPAFVVVRMSPHEITNIHLGGQRGSVARLRELVPEDAWEAAMLTCARAARAHGCFQVGVDLMFERGLRAHYVCEANAFGDFFPSYEQNGETIFEREIRELEAF